MFCLLTAQGLFLVSNRRYSGEILLLLHNKYRAARLSPHRHSVRAGCDSPHWTVYVRERATLNMITDGNGVCVCVCGYMGRQDRRSAGRDNCSNLSSPSHSHPSAQTSKSLPLGLPRTCTHTHTQDPHINPIPNSHFSLHSSPKSITVVLRLIEMDMQRHGKRGLDNKCISTALSSRGYHLLMRCKFTHACTFAHMHSLSLASTYTFTETESWRGVV